VPIRAMRRSMCHVLGDTYGQTIGAESMFAKYLLGFDQGLGEELSQLLKGERRVGSSVVLTIDSDLCLYAYDLMDEYWGAVVLMNYETGEILASVSQPTFDTKYMPEYISGERELAASAMVNRATMGRYTPGSTFKIVTLTAALRYIPDIENRVFDCHGPMVFDRESGEYLPDVRLKDSAFAPVDQGKIAYAREREGAEDTGAEPSAAEIYSAVRDYQGEYHGEIDIFEAFAKSCNTTFARLALEIGPVRLARAAEELGIGEEFLFEDIQLYSSAFESGDTDLTLAWAGVGQHRDLMTPMQMCMLAGAIANDGVMMEPRLLSRVADSSNRITRTAQAREHGVVLSAPEAAFVHRAMTAVVEDGTGRGAAIEGLQVAGKTGTAEISSNKQVKTHAWFAGYVAEEEHPLAVCVVLEQAGGGGSVAAPLARKLLQKAVELGY